DVDDALARIELVIIFDPELARVSGQLLDLLAAFGIGDAALAVGGLDVVVDDGQGLVRRAHLAARHPQAFERLRARHLMDEMAVDVDEAQIALGVEDMIVPDLIVQRTRLGHNALQRPWGANSRGIGRYLCRMGRGRKRRPRPASCAPPKRADKSEPVHFANAPVIALPARLVAASEVSVPDS